LKVQVKTVRTVASSLSFHAENSFYRVAVNLLYKGE